VAFHVPARPVDGVLTVTVYRPGVLELVANSRLVVVPDGLTRVPIRVAEEMGCSLYVIARKCDTRRSLVMLLGLTETAMLKGFVTVSGTMLFTVKLVTALPLS